MDQFFSKEILKNTKVEGNDLLILNNLLKDLDIIEKHIKEVEELPFIVINKADNTKQKETIAYKMYYKLTTQKITYIKEIVKILTMNGETEDGNVISQFLERYAKDEIKFEG